MKSTAGRFDTQAQPLTHIAPTRRGMSWPAWGLLIFMKRFSKLQMARELDFIHFARWQRVRSKKLPRLSPMQPQEDFTNDFFMFATNYNGDWDQYIDTFARIPRIQKGMRWLWRCSDGYPGPFPIRTFKDWIRYHTYAELLYYDAYRNSTVRNISAALKVKRAIDRFLDESPGIETAAQFKKRYLRMAREIAPHLGSAPGLSPTAKPVSTATSSAPEGQSLENVAVKVRSREVLHGRSRNRPASGPILGRLSRRNDRDQSFLTAMSPMEVKPNHEVTERVRDAITAATSGSGLKPFKQCPMLHMARFLIIDDLRPTLGSTTSASLKTNYLLFMAEIDGPVEDFLDCLYAVAPAFVNSVWGQCLGYPANRGGPVYFRRYIERSSLPVHLPFVAFPGHTVLEIKGALELHVNLLEWMANVRTANMKDEDLKVEWQNWLAQFVVGTGATP